MIKKVLIANRGEIACRIMRTCRRLGVRTVAVYSTADAQSRHSQEADEAVWIGKSAANASYLRGEAIIAAALRTGADSIHPGYGFLAENGAFARECVAAGLTFIGPTAETIELMGHKHAAKALAMAHRVPVLPSFGGDDDQTDEGFAMGALEIGYPIMVKAAAGGGGKGMRLVENEADLAAALASARREAKQAFGSDELLLEKALLAPRHIEVQIFGDETGNVVHLGERDCSIQRRQQKIVEEAPASGLSAELRHRLGEMAVAVGRAAGYTNAGTVEFLVDGNQIYFLEMNTRIQVEHPVTELVTGQDLIAWQIAVAQGLPLPLDQAQIDVRGHALEVRLYAEDPAQDFLPQVGDVALWRPFVGEGVRIDSGLFADDQISVHYDPLVAKVIVYSHNRAGAIYRMGRVLAQTRLLGPRNNLQFLRDLIGHDLFLAGNVSTRFVSRYFSDWGPILSEAQIELGLCAATAARFMADMARTNGMVVYWRPSVHAPLSYHFAEYGAVSLWPSADKGMVTIDAGMGGRLVHGRWQDDDTFVLEIEGRRQSVTLVKRAKTWWVAQDDWTMRLHEQVVFAGQDAGGGDVSGSLQAPMQGIVLEVMVSVGDRVSRGQPLIKLEAMKMEHTIRSTAAGEVTAVYFAAGDQVDNGVVLLSVQDLES